jgi:hypothetical protein
MADGLYTIGPDDAFHGAKGLDVLKTAPDRSSERDLHEAGSDARRRSGICEDPVKLVDIEWR